MYCYATSYIKARVSTPKKDFIKRLTWDLAYIEAGSLIEMSTSSDPYPPVESILRYTRRALELLSKYNVRVLITTKSNIVVRDVDLLSKIPSAVMITITTLDEKVSRLIEPGAPLPRLRLDAVKQLLSTGIPTGVRVDPIIPYVNDDPYAIEDLIGKLKECGAMHIVTSTYKAKWDSLRRLQVVIPDVGQKIKVLYEDKGVYFHGYRYLPKSLRASLLKPVVKYATYFGLTVATCREGLGTEFFKAPSCDGSHLIGKPVNTSSRWFAEHE